jgi:hypothetical protein
MHSPDQTPVQELWLKARSDRKTARLLNQALFDPTLSRILLLHREELFPRGSQVNHPEEIFWAATRTSGRLSIDGGND